MTALSSGSSRKLHAAPRPPIFTTEGHRGTQRETPRRRRAAHGAGRVVNLFLRERNRAGTTPPSVFPLCPSVALCGENGGGGGAAGSFLLPPSPAGSLRAA